MTDLREDRGSLAEEAVIMHGLCVRWSSAELDKLPVIEPVGEVPHYRDDLKIAGRTIRVSCSRITHDQFGNVNPRLVRVDRLRDGVWETLDTYPAADLPQTATVVAIIDALEDLD